MGVQINPLACRLHATSNVLGIRKFVIYFEGNNLVGRGWEMQEGLAVEPLMHSARVWGETPRS